MKAVEYKIRRVEGMINNLRVKVSMTQGRQLQVNRLSLMSATTDQLEEKVMFIIILTCCSVLTVLVKTCLLIYKKKGVSKHGLGIQTSPAAMAQFVL